MKMPVPRLPAKAKFNRDSAYPARTPQISEITVEANAMNMVFHIHVANKGDYYDIADGLPQNEQ